MLGVMMKGGVSCLCLVWISHPVSHSLILDFTSFSVSSSSSSLGGKTFLGYLLGVFFFSSVDCWPILGCCVVCCVVCRGLGVLLPLFLPWDESKRCREPATYEDRPMMQKYLTLLARFEKRNVPRGPALMVVCVSELLFSTCEGVVRPAVKLAGR